MNNKIKFLLVLASFFYANFANAQATNTLDNYTFISKTDTALKSDLKYNDPMRASYNIGGAIGVDVSSFEGALFGAIDATYSPKHFTFMGSYSFDVSNQDFITKNSLLNYGNSYKSLDLTAVFNYKDETTTKDYDHVVGINVLDRSNTGNGTIETTFNGYKTTSSFDTRTTRGFGVSLNNRASNTFVNTAKIDSTKEFLTLANGSALPAEFILPFKTSVIGIGIHSGSFTSYKLKTQYNDLKPFVIKASSYNIKSAELLFSPTVSASDFIFYETNGAKQSLAVDDVKVRRLGFRLSVITNEFGKASSKIANRKPGFYIKAEAGMKTGIFPKRAFDKPDPDFLDKMVLGFLSNPVYMKFSYGFSF